MPGGHAFDFYLVIGTDPSQTVSQTMFYSHAEKRSMSVGRVLKNVHQRQQAQSSVAVAFVTFDMIFA